MAAINASSPKTPSKRKLAVILRNLPIRTKLFVYAGLLMALMLSLATFTLIQVNEIRNRHLPARSAAREMEAAILSMRVNELNFTNEADSLNAEFYLKQKSLNVDAWQENYRIFETNYKELLELFQSGEVKNELELIQPLIVKYRDTFVVLTGTYRERGFQSFGREGVLRERAESLQTSLSNNSAQITFFKAKAAQDRFLLYREMTAVTDFQAHAAQLKTQLTNAADKVLFDEYVKIFEELVAIYQRIGTSNTSGLRGQLDLLADEVVPHIQRAESSVLSLTNRSISSVVTSVHFTTTALTIVGILTTIFLARFIVKRIVMLGEAAKRLSNGSFDYRLPVESTDELGQLSRSFNTMAEQLQKNQKTLHERAKDLAQSVKRFELVSRAVNEAVYDWDMKTSQLQWGEGIVSVFGYKHRDKLTTIEWWTDRIHPADADAIDASLSESFSRHTDSWKKEYRLKKADGTYVYCEHRGFIEYHNGQPTRMVGSIIDISHQKALERAKDEFISIASHQLRTPLGSIRWNLELLLEKVRSLPSELATYARDAYTSTRRMSELVNDLLSVARIEQNRVQNIPEKTDIIAVIKEAIAEMQPLAKRRKVTIDSSDIKNQHAELWLDPKRFREVVQNMLSNAVKYTQGSVQIRVETRAKDLVVSITDNGIGIPLEDQPKLFAKFYRASNVTTTDTEGSGLGLFVVRSYVEAWGGRVWFTSTVNKGTTFYVSIPHKPRTPKHK